MDRGIDFLKSQINNAVDAARTFLVKNLEDHEKQAEDPRFRDLCSRAIPHMREHQRMLEEYQKEIGAEAGVGKNILGKALGVARDLADAARESDFLRLVGDIVTSRQSQDTFATFREAGRALANPQLQRIGEIGRAAPRAVRSRRQPARAADVRRARAGRPRRRSDAASRRLDCISGARVDERQRSRSNGHGAP